jgi:hypothetical protein
MKVSHLSRLFALAILAGAVTFAERASAAVIVLDDFNVDEGHFGLAPNFSGSTSNTAAASTADRITTDSFEGAGNEAIAHVATTAGAATRIRFLSGGGSAAGGSGQPANTVITTTSGTDGWIGLALKTSDPGWDVQLWLEGPENNGASQKPLIADGQWHIYQWNLDDETGGPDGWQAAGIPGILGGDIDVQDGNYTIDSVLFRHAAAPATSSISMDYLVRNTDGQITNPVPEPTSFAIAGIAFAAIGLSARRRIV